MSMTEILTLEALARYRPDLFDLLELPGVPDIDDMGVENADQVRTTWTISNADFIKYLCFKARGLSVAIANPDWMKEAIGTWSAMHKHEWQRAFNTLFYKYNPIWNKDGSINRSENSNYTDTTTHVGVNTDTETLDNTSFTNGYNNGSYSEIYPPGAQPGTNLKWTHADKNTARNTIGHSLNNTDTTNGDKHGGEEIREKGNIGVTTTQQMLKEEREIALYSIEDIIADAFIKEFCLLLW